MSEPQDFTPGFFGKLPALGDFVQRQLPSSFVKQWDGWLQDSIASSKSQLGEHWLDIYLHSPVWRFAISPGIGGSTGWSGVMIPSVDRVGRYFPLTLAAPMPPNSATFEMVKAKNWFDRAETTLLSALEERGFELDQFTQIVAELGACVDDKSHSGIFDEDSLSKSGLQINLAAVNQAEDALSSVAEVLTKNRYGSFSLWWTSGSELICPSLLMCPGLPESSSFSAMLDGGWIESNWHSLTAEPIEPDNTGSLTELIDA